MQLQATQQRDKYKCKNKTKIPDTGERLAIECQFDGTFEVRFFLHALPHTTNT